MNCFGISRLILKVKQSRKMLGNEDRMKISTKGRYAVRVMLDLALNNNGECIKVKEIAARQGISEKYLESIVSVLSKQKFVKALRGKGGGYRLAKTPAEYTIGSILRITEGSMAPVACLDDHPNQCERASSCKTLQMWEKFYNLINEYFDGITLEDLLEQKSDVGDYII